MKIDFPDYFHAHPLKEKLSWLYFEVYKKHPVVVTDAPNGVLALVRDRVSKSGPINNIDERVLEIAEECIRHFPLTIEAIGRWGNMGVGYYLLRAPVCFLIPFILFEAVPKIRSPWIDPAREDLERALADAWKEDHNIAKNIF